LDEKSLRKAWLKQHFASWEYHEEMLRMHRGVMDVTKRALAKAEIDTSCPPSSPTVGFANRSEEALHFKHRYLPLMERNDNLGQYRKEEWPRYRHSATFRSIPDYNRYLFDGIDAFAWLTHDELVEQGKFWGPMDQMAANIRYTADGNWDAHPEQPYWILDESCTGPITYPADWRIQVLGPNADHLYQTDGARVTAGDPAPLSGLWQALDPRGGEVRASAGEILPDLGSAYGLTVWQRVRD